VLFVACVSGQNGGRDTDKAGRCAGEAFPWDQPPCELLSVPRSVAVVPDAVSYMTLRMVSKQVGTDFCWLGAPC